MDIGGHVDPGFEAVQEAFEANFDKHGDVGAAFALYHQGQKVVDIWGGLKNDKTQEQWLEDTLTLVFSSTKGVTAIMANRLAEQGRLDLDAPVADYWPEFQQAGKGSITTRDLLSHKAGLPAFDQRMPQEEALKWTPAIDALALQAPLWEPRTKHGYHAVTYGWLVGEVIRRVTGQTPGEHLRAEIAGPLGLDLWIGLPESEEPRTSRLITSALPSQEEIAKLPKEQLDRMMAMADPNSLAMRALNVTDPPFVFNSRAVHAAELPAANGITTARSLAKIYAATVGEIDGIRLINDETVASATREQSSGPDAVLGVDTRFGSGFFLHSEFSPLLSPKSFGHAGAGGSLAYADPDANIGFAYVMTQMQQNLAGDPRTLSLTSAVKSCLDREK